MARLLSLDEEEGPDPACAIADDGQIRSDPNLNRFTAALSIYPIVSVLASYIDLNTLSDLSHTCRQTYTSLLQHRSLLISQTLRCANENANPAERLGNALSASHQIWTAYGRHGLKIGRITSGRVGACARDMVGECRKCGTVICRNCAIKPPPPNRVKLRHRRLCRTCMKHPLDGLTTEIRCIDQDGNSTTNQDTSTCEYHIYARDPCTCAEAAWICQPCGQSMQQADTTYLRGWKWRTRYSHCGGLGAGLGEGNEGVECGRDQQCLAARIVEKDVECDAAELAALRAESAKAEVEGRHWNGSSYSTQEMVGIGGRVKTKVKKRVRVGAIVKEYEDERVSEDFLGREQNQLNRSWCSWCERAVIGRKDLDGATRSTESISSCSSAGDAANLS